MNLYCPQSSIDLFKEQMANPCYKKMSATIFPVAVAMVFGILFGLYASLDYYNKTTRLNSAGAPKWASLSSSAKLYIVSKVFFGVIFAILASVNCIRVVYSAEIEHMECRARYNLTQAQF